MYRQPLFPVALKSPNIHDYIHLEGPILDAHELAEHLPLDANEILFLSKIREEGILSPELITNDIELAKKNYISSSNKLGY
jgi:hypothetical protein